ncbi:MAG: CoA transferase [Candidatus Tectomicrobia bacterium]|nr:CoA transferase [Candidatus Tectomicrobia bacterium]
MENAEAFSETLIPWVSERTEQEIFHIDEIEHPVAGKFTYIGAPYKMKETPWQLKRPAPRLGEHNEETYCKVLGYEKSDLVRLRESGII